MPGWIEAGAAAALEVSGRKDEGPSPLYRVGGWEGNTACSELGYNFWGMPEAYRIDGMGLAMWSERGR